MVAPCIIGVKTSASGKPIAIIKDLKVALTTAPALCENAPFVKFSAKVFLFIKSYDSVDGRNLDSWD